MTRPLLLTVALVAALLAPTPAVAQSDDCLEITQPNPNPPPPSEVTVGVYCPGEDDSGSPPPGTPIGGGGGGDDGGPSCSWEPSPFHESEIRPSGEVWWRYYYECDDGTSGDTWLCENCDGPADDEEPDWEAIRAELLLEATASLALPGPQLRHLYDSAPDGQVLGVVRAETWWWTETAAPVTARAEDGPLWVEVTAEPASLEVDPGDGGPVVSCPNGGVPYDFGRAYHDQEGGSDCLHVYQQTSASRPDEEFTVTATLHWEVHWVSGGPLSGAGSLPSDATTETFGLPVGELQSAVSR
ncbi:hypothetical protein FTX61_21305 [Nitriliruptoraceae bacterium ZYF776]|nr:hypothetical protein [Profundirhabdus halotolerans]